jgi:uncharacterized damage-inducible protein DinB
MNKNRETAWVYMKDTLLCIMWVGDTWINYSIQALEDPNGPFPYHKYQTWNALIDYNQQVTSKTKKYLSDIQKKDLLKRVFRVNNDGIRRRSPVKDALIHVFIEELRHRDDKIAIPWQIDIEPLDMSWLSVMKKTIPLWVMN